VSKNIFILAIESSCDDTSAAVLVDGKVLSNVTATQSVHKEYGGVVPELASRAHQSHIIPVVDAALRKAGIEKRDLNAIGFTRGPGLMGSLVVGVSFAKGLSLALDIPLIEVHHMHAHLLSPLIDDPKPDFPYLCLTVSGGHTELVIVRAPLEYEKIGQTRDDAAGEAFDKAGKMMGLPYPSGPIIDKLASKGKRVFDFPIVNMPGLDFSFSGLKTSFRYFLRDKVSEDKHFIEQNKEDICASIQAAIIDNLCLKLKQAVTQTGIKEVAIAGGVSANSGLRAELAQYKDSEGWKLYFPALQYCTDNAAMIGLTAHFKYKAGMFSDQTVSPEARLSS
jgi:N6-L-threonylcarbamoyladenine synthase